MVWRCYASFSLLLIKNYPSFLIRPLGSNEFIKWEDFIIQGNYLDYFTIRFNVYCVIENNLVFQNFNDCFTINIEGTSTSIEFNFQPIVDVFKYISLDNDFNETIVEEDQKEAAKT